MDWTPSVANRYPNCNLDTMPCHQCHRCFHPFAAKQPWATEHHATSGGGRFVWRFWLPMRPEAQFFLVKFCVCVLPWKFYSCLGFLLPPVFGEMLRHLRQRLNCKFHSISWSPNTRSATYNCCYMMVVFFNKYLWDWKTPSQSSSTNPEHHSQVASFLASWCKTWFSADVSNHWLVGWWFYMLF